MTRASPHEHASEHNVVRGDRSLPGRRSTPYGWAERRFFNHGCAMLFKKPSGVIILPLDRRKGKTYFDTPGGRTEPIRQGAPLGEPCQSCLAPAIQEGTACRLWSPSVSTSKSMAKEQCSWTHTPIQCAQGKCRQASTPLRSRQGKQQVGERAREIIREKESEWKIRGEVGWVTNSL